MIHKRSTALEQSAKKNTEGLKHVYRYGNLTLSSDVNQGAQMFGLHERYLTNQ